MTSFWAKIRIREDETAQKLLQTFFKEFNPQSVIQVKDGNVFVKIFFDKNPPVEIAEAIGGYKDIEFCYGEIPNEGNQQFEESDNQYQQYRAEADKNELPESNEPQTPQEEESKDENMLLVQEEHSSPLAEGEKENAKRNKRTSDKIPEIDRMANNSMSFEDFLAKVIKWLGIEKKREYFVHLIEAAANTEKISWKNLEEKLENNGIQTKSYDKIFATKIVAKKLSEIQSDGGILSVIKLVVDYKDFDFRGNIEKNVRSILEEMGLNKCITNQQELFLHIANAGVRLIGEDIDMKVICAKIGYLTEEQIDDAIMDFSTFVNSFLKENGKERMKAKDFIQKLQKMVTTEGETLL